MKRIVRLHLFGDENVWLDFPLPEGETFVNFMWTVRMNGFVMSEKMYVPFNQIRMAQECTVVEASVLDFARMKAN